MNKLRKRITISILIAAVILVMGLIFFINYLRSVTDYQARVNAITFSKIDISEVQDGTYIGECDIDFIYAKVEVIVQKGKIINIDLLEHKNEKGQAAEVIPDRIVAEQTVDVDAVSSATNSSKAIKKAVENALISGTK